MLSDRPIDDCIHQARTTHSNLTLAKATKDYLGIGHKMHLADSTIAVKSSHSQTSFPEHLACDCELMCDTTVVI